MSARGKGGKGKGGSKLGGKSKGRKKGTKGISMSNIYIYIERISKVT